MKKNELWFMQYPLPEKLVNLIKNSDFQKVANIAYEYLLKNYSFGIRKRIEFELDRINRWRINYPYTLEKAYNLLRKEIEDLTYEEFMIFLSRGCIDSKNIDDQTFIHRRFIPNFFWLCKEQEKRRKKKNIQKALEPKKKLKERVFKIIENLEGHVLPIEYHIRVKVKIKENAIKKDEKVRVWIPIPREDSLNTDLKIIFSRPEIKKISNEKQRTVYFEENISEYSEFLLEYQFKSYGFFKKIDINRIEPYNEDEIYKRYTLEKPPHITFTSYLVDLAEKIVRDEKNPYLKAKRIWKWITYNVKYTYAHDYALYDNISEYVARYRRGDCGMQALLFITLCRISGIPARWQSGWYLNPIRTSMHDWAQFYIEPYGWLYADPSFGSFRHGEEWRNDFYLGGIDGYRLAANIDISTPFDPPKKYIRSDPVDNQRGEVEWAKGNLYYDKWEYSLEIVKMHEK